jgi:hypothetical protein
MDDVGAVDERAELGKRLRDSRRSRTVQYDAHGAILTVFADEDDCTPEVGVDEPWAGNEELASE